ncbi:hypothetical protein A1356_15480 [Methylomonas koyamae]|uniref:Uncharacterized protein n=1 Tax=Methylomonas koyamae TaxID=702114 RepID=A0AA91I4M1_9GAMM|nr:hypothetical protein A1356_15480 [Methylomonas koyamae]
MLLFLQFAPAVDDGKAVFYRVARNNKVAFAARQIVNSRCLTAWQFARCAKLRSFNIGLL